MGVVGIGVAKAGVLNPGRRVGNRHGAGIRIVGRAGDAAADTTKEKEIQGAFVIKDEAVQFSEVKTGIAGDRFFEVISGLQPNDEVVTVVRDIGM